MALRIVELTQAGAQLARLVHEAGAGAEVVITEGGRPVAKLVPVSGADREPGSARGLFTVPEDFDAPLDDFREYM